jgi:acetoin utilization deacetylase AcuC-like enzyme
MAGKNIVASKSKHAPQERFLQRSTSFACCPTDVKPETPMSAELTQMDLLDESLTPLWISLFLSIEIPDAEVHHAYADGKHQFRIAGSDFTYEVCLDQRALMWMDAEQLTHALEFAVDRILSGAGPQGMAVRGPLHHHAQAA